MKFVFAFLAPLAALAAELPPPAGRAVDFTKDIQPLFEAACVKCHAKGKDKGGFSLETREVFLKGGDTSAAAVLGKSAESLIVKLVASDDPDERMPKKGTYWTPEQVGLLRAWIDQGAAWPDGVSFAKPAPENLAPRSVQAPAGAGNPIDRLLLSYFAQHGGAGREAVSDAVFARRVWLDVVGLLPTAEQLAAFENDRSPGKRDALVDKLLADERGYADHWLNFWNDLLRNDYRGTGFIDGGRKQISGWLYSALRSNKPYDQFVRELTDPTPATEGFTSGIIWRGNVNASMTQPMQAAQSVSQVFMGINLKCASCHDSFINDWSLADAYGLAAVYSDDVLELVQCDKPTGKKAAVRFLYPEIGDISAGLPKAERTRRLAELLTSEKNGRLARTLANRLWARLLGHGLVEPLDDMDKPAWSPQLLDWLATDLIANKWNIKHTIRTILTSRAYALPSVEAPKEGEKTFTFTGPQMRRLSAEQFSDALNLLAAQWPALPNSMEFNFGTDGLTIPKWVWTPEPTSTGPKRDATRAANAQLDHATAKLTAAKTQPDITKALAETDAAIAAANAARAQLAAAQNAKATGAPGEIIARPGSDRHWIVLRKTFDLPAAPSQARALVVASQGFEIFVNGKEAKAKMSDGFRNGRAKLYDLTAHLVQGKNAVVINVSSHTEKGMNSTEREQFPQSIHHENKSPGFAFYVRTAEGFELTSDATWKTRRSPDGDWRSVALNDADWANATPVAPPVDQGPSLEPNKRRDFASIPVELDPTLLPGISLAARAANIRASMLVADPLQTALERPNREVTTAARPNVATTIQALELTNGSTLDAELKRIAAHHLTAETTIPQLYRSSLGRAPTEAEQTIAAELLTAKPTVETTADLLWLLVNHPEFQLIR